jgi:hypothetical protein
MATYYPDTDAIIRSYLKNSKVKILPIPEPEGDPMD